MKTYKSIYSFEVMDKVKEGKRVCMVDRAEFNCAEVKELNIGEWVEVLSEHSKNSNRFDFWVEEDTEEVEE